MNDVRVLKCPSCGGPLDFENRERSTIRCPYCGTSMLVPEELKGGRRPEVFESLSGQVENVRRIGQYIRAEQKAKAINLYQETFGGDFKSAKAAIDRLATGKPLRVGNMTIETQSTSKEHPSIFEGNEAAAAAATTAAVTGASGCGVLVAVLAVVLVLVGAGAAVFFATSTTTSSSTTSFSVTFESAVGQANVFAFARPELTFAGEGSGPGLLSDARKIDVDGDGNVYVADYETSRVQVYSPAGAYLSGWTPEGQPNILSMAVSRDGQVYLAAGLDLLIYEGQTGEPLGELSYPEANVFMDLAAIPDGGLIAAWTRFGEDNIVRFDPAGNVDLVVEAVLSGATDQSELNPTLAADGLGNIYVLGTFNNAVAKLSPEGVVITRFGSDGDGPGQFTAPLAIAVDNQSRIYVADFGGIKVFGSGGNYIDGFDVSGSVRDMAFNDQNELFVLTLDQEVIKFVLQEE